MSKCFKCGKMLEEPSGAFFGSSASAALQAGSYPCKSCNTDFCFQCMSKLNKGSRICPCCSNDIGW